MALYDTTRSPVGGQSLLGRLSAMFAALVSTLISWNDARITRGSLARLTDRELDDIGLCRGDIDEVAARLAR
jgi:uncharacterized protein YjiS (DUF1127 family)